jgi:hypothetical protein
VDLVEGCSEVGGQGVGGGDDVLAGLDLYGAVAAGGLLTNFLIEVISQKGDRAPCL